LNTQTKHLWAFGISKQEIDASSGAAAQPPRH